MKITIPGIGGFAISRNAEINSTVVSLLLSDSTALVAVGLLAAATFVRMFT